MKRKYIIPNLQVEKFLGESSLLVSSLELNKNIVVSTPEGGNIPVAKTDEGFPDGDIDYAKDHNAWSAWDD